MSKLLYFFYVFERHKAIAECLWLCILKYWRQSNFMINVFKVNSDKHLSTNYDKKLKLFITLSLFILSNK